jgi:hypothetical protein
MCGHCSFLLPYSQTEEASARPSVHEARNLLIEAFDMKSVEQGSICYRCLGSGSRLIEILSTKTNLASLVIAPCSIMTIGSLHTRILVTDVAHGRRPTCGASRRKLAGPS